MRLVAFLVLLLPSFWFAWQHQDNPRFGDFGDDAFYFMGAKTIATGQDYRALSLPGAPYQTKYPPGYPAYLSAAWGNGASFPENIKQAVWLQWRRAGRRGPRARGSCGGLSTTASVRSWAVDAAVGEAGADEAVREGALGLRGEQLLVERERDAEVFVDQPVTERDLKDVVLG